MRHLKTTGHSLALYSSAAFLMLLLVSKAVGSDLDLELTSVKTRFSLSEAIEVRVTVVNRSRDYHTIYPWFNPETGQSLENLGFTSEVSFIIEGEDGRKLSYIGGWSCAKVVTPDLSDFMLLPPDFLWGRHLSLNTGIFAYDFKKPGTYHMRAIFSTSARSWLAEKAEDAPRPGAEVPLKITSAYQGRVESNELVIVVE